jgi:hypothetical protein
MESIQFPPAAPSPTSEGDTSVPAGCSFSSRRRPPPTTPRRLPLLFQLILGAGRRRWRHRFRIGFEDGERTWWCWGQEMVKVDMSTFVSIGVRLCTMSRLKLQDLQAQILRHYWLLDRPGTPTYRITALGRRQVSCYTVPDREAD